MGISNEIEEIIVKYLSGPLSAKENAILNRWINESESNKQFFEQLTHPDFVAAELQKFYSYNEEPAWNRIKAVLHASKKVNKFNWKYIVAAACLAGVIITSAYFFFNKGKSQPVNNETVVVQKDVEAPKETKAMIQLADGKTVLLESIQNGVLAEQGNVNVVKNEDGQIIYKGDAAEPVFNTLVNPRGGVAVSLVLNDGTKVWLNSESSLRYPTAFTGKERSVEITGEAYFEVAKDPARKFIVSGNDVRTEVLGTHFNINTYQDEAATKVTLLEGSVKVLKGSSNGMLKPGQQATFNNNSPQLSIAVTDVDKVIAWKAGVFNFDDDDLPSVMRQLARWYNVDISYTGAIPKDLYSGLISRQLTLSNVLKILKVAGVKFSIEGKKIKIETGSDF